MSMWRRRHVAVAFFWRHCNFDQSQEILAKKDNMSLMERLTSSLRSMSTSVEQITMDWSPGGQLAYRSTARLDAWRQSLPPIKEMQSKLRSQNRNQAPIQDKTEMSWRAAARMSRDMYEREVKGSTSQSFQEWLISKSLVDKYDRLHSYLRISLTEKCNLRCLYCMPEEGIDLTPNTHLLTVDEIEKLVQQFASAGVRKVRLTGGEPTLRKDLVSIVERISKVKGIEDIGMTSNGFILSRSLEDLKKSGLTLINLSLDSLQAGRFEQMTRRKGHGRVLEAMDKALDLGYDPVKLNVVVMKGINDDEVVDFVELTRHKNLNVRFIEYMPFDGNVWSTEKLVTYKDMHKTVDNYAKEVSGTGLVRQADGYGEVAKNFRVTGYRGSVSFITSMTSAFCGDCNRLRLMADGNIKVCLFGNNEVSLRDAIREGATEEDLLAVISAAVQSKKAAHAGMDILHTLKNRPMVKIGG